MSTEFIVKTATLHMPHHYGKVAICEVEKGVNPKMISPRAKGMVRIVEAWGPLQMKGERSAFALALDEARRTCAVLNLRSDQPIKTWCEDYTGAPTDMRWHATLGDYDLGARVGSGATPEAAIDDLLEQLEG